MKNPSKKSLLTKRSLNKRNASNTTLISHPELQIPSQIVPDCIPEFQDVWQKYIQDKNTRFNCFLDDYIQNETLIRDFYTNYLDEIKQMEDVKKEIDKEKYKINEISVLLRFDTTVNTEYLKKLEDNLNNQLKINERKLLERQENVLKHQTDLKLHLNVRQNIKNQIKGEFNEYCQQNLNVIVPIFEENQLVIKTM